MVANGVGRSQYNRGIGIFFFFFSTGMQEIQDGIRHIMEVEKYKKEERLTRAEYFEQRW